MRSNRILQIEELAGRRLVKFERTLNRSLTFPLDIELFGKIVLDLSVCWEEIEESPCEQVLGALRPGRRLVVMNERRRRLMDENPGRRTLVQAYQIAHWDLFVNRSGGGQSLPFEMPGPSLFGYRNSSGGQVQIVETLAFSDPGCDLLALAKASAVQPNEAVSVNCYAAAILMPSYIVADEARRIDCTQFRNLFQLALQFGVTTSALRIRLEQLNLLILDPVQRQNF